MESRGTVSAGVTLLLLLSGCAAEAPVYGVPHPTPLGSCLAYHQPQHHLMFASTRCPVVGDLFPMAWEVTLLDGTHPLPGSLVRCPVDGETPRLHPAYIQFEPCVEKTCGGRIKP